jgi:hypothetical protein
MQPQSIGLHIQASKIEGTPPSFEIKGSQSMVATYPHVADDTLPSPCASTEFYMGPGLSTYVYIEP